MTGSCELIDSSLKRLLKTGSLGGLKRLASQLFHNFQEAVKGTRKIRKIGDSPLTMPYWPASPSAATTAKREVGTKEK